MNLLLTAVYLQFFQTIASAPPVRDANYVRRPASSQNNVKFAMNSNENGNNRANSRKNNPNKVKRSNTASNSSARPKVDVDCGKLRCILHHFNKFFKEKLITFECGW